MPVINSLGIYAYNVAETGVVAWNDIDFAKSGDLNLSAVSMFENTSNYLKVDGYDFGGIPLGATIDGIQIELINRGGSNSHHVAARIVKEGVIGSTEVSTVQWPSSPTTQTLPSVGDISSLWGETWSQSNILASGFGFAIAVSGNDIADVYQIKIFVHYTEELDEPSGDFTLFCCGHQNNNSQHMYDNLTFDEGKTGTSFRYSDNTNFDYGYWNINEGSGNVLYPVNSAHASGDWEHGYIGEPDWNQGMDSNSPINDRHVEYGNFGTGRDLNGVLYQRAIRTGSSSGGNIDRTFKFDTSAPTGDFTIFMAVTHSGEYFGNLLSYINSGRPNDADYIDFLLRGGNDGLGSNKYEIIVYDENSIGVDLELNPLGGRLAYGDNRVTPLIAVSYGGPSRELAIYVGDGQINHGVNPLGFYANSTNLATDRRVVNSGHLFLPGIHGSYGVNNHPSYYEEFGIANTYMSSGEIYDLFKTHIRKTEFPELVDSLLDVRKDKPISGFDTTGKGYIEFNVPNYSGYVQSNITFSARPDPSVFFRLDNDPNALKINAFITNDTNNSSGVEVIFGNDYLDWSGHPIILPSGNHFIEVTGGFPNSKYNFHDLDANLLDREQPDQSFSRFKAHFRHVDQGSDHYTADVKIFGIEVAYSGAYKPNAFNDDTTLYTFGVFLEDSGIPMHISGFPLNESIDLFVFGSHKHNDSTNLFINGFITDTGTVPLFLKGNLITEQMTLHTIAGFVNSKNPDANLFIEGAPVTGVIPLYVRGILADNSSMNLYTKGNPPGFASGEIPLYMLAAASGQGAGFKTMTMYVDSFDNPYPTGSMNLFLSNVDVGTSITKTMNLFMRSLGDLEGFQQNSSNISMFINNDVIAHNSGIPLFINQQTASNASGYIPVSGFMNLFINRQFESVAHNFPMFINGPSGYNQGVTLFMQALPNNRSGVNLYIDGIGETNSSINLYSHGY